MKIEEYESVKKWFESGRRPKTEETRFTYGRYMRHFCASLGLDPDMIINQIKSAPNPKTVINTMKLKIANYLHDELHFTERSIHMLLHAFHTFLRANGIAYSTADMWEFISEAPAWLKRERMIPL